MTGFEFFKCHNFLFLRINLDDELLVVRGDIIYSFFSLQTKFFFLKLIIVIDSV